MGGDSGHLEFRLGAADAGRPVGNVLRTRYGFSRGMLRRLKRLQGVSLNGQAVRLKDCGRENDLVTVTLREPEESWITPRDIPLTVYYEDADLLVVDKEAGMLVHPNSYRSEDTVANAVLYRWKQRGIEARFRPVFRLDRDTSGLLAVAGNRFANHRLVQQMQAGKMRRRYLAVAQGVVDQDRGLIDYPISPEPAEGGRRVVSPAGKRAVTRFWVLRRLPGATLLRLELETGRTHQIRVHLAHEGFPLFGDTLYGGDDAIMGRQALHSAALTFYAPRDGREVILQSPLPKDMQSLLTLLGPTGSENLD